MASQGAVGDGDGQQRLSENAWVETLRKAGPGAKAHGRPRDQKIQNSTAPQGGTVAKAQRSAPLSRTDPTIAPHGERSRGARRQDDALVGTAARRENERSVMATWASGVEVPIPASLAQGFLR